MTTKWIDLTIVVLLLSYIDFSCYVQAPRRYANAPTLYNMLGESYLHSNNWTAAEFWYNQALRSKSNHLPALLTIAKLMEAKVRLGKQERTWNKPCRTTLLWLKSGTVMLWQCTLWTMCRIITSGTSIWTVTLWSQNDTNSAHVNNAEIDALELCYVDS